MRWSHVPVKMYKKFFIILLCVLAGMFVLEFIASMLGNPITETTINGVRVVPQTTVECLLNAAFSAFVWSGIVNFFLTVKVIKEGLRLSHWSAGLVVLMTLFFVIELIISILLVVPNIIIFGLKGRKKNRIYEVEF